MNAAAGTAIPHFHSVIEAGSMSRNRDLLCRTSLNLAFNPLLKAFKLSWKTEAFNLFPFTTHRSIQEAATDGKV
jgi:hypothetical protein